MKQLVLVGALMGALVVSVAAAQTAEKAGASGTALGSVHLMKKVLADGKPLAAGTYQVRLTSDEPKPAVGQSPGGEAWVEFVRGGKVAGREVATVVSAEEIGTIAESARPRAGTSKVEVLKGDDYVRVWINKGGVNYIINMPPAT